MNKALRIAALKREIARLEAEPEVTYHCAVCLRSKEDVVWQLLTDVTVVVADGEEGYSNITLLLCETDLDSVVEGLRKLGFIDHRHGSTSTLEDPKCPGYNAMDACPTPTHYGNVTWGRVPPQDQEDL